ncbi:MAG: FHA domain-containing protein [Rhizobiales bacterium]|nr:FHA domain-containing protein [Rhizobacter sp.]
MERPGARAWLDVLDRDGQPRQSFAATAWPLRIGRALDNDVVLSDPHVAAHHVAIDATDGDLSLTIADTRNGALLGRRRLRSGDSALLARDGDPVEFTIGRTQLRLRLPGHAVAAELPLMPAGSLARRALPIAFAALLLVAGTLFDTWLDTDPEGLARAVGSALLVGLVSAAVWCTGWALMSKTFTRQAHFGWHLRVFLYASLALLAVGALPTLLAFALSWPWLSDFDFVGTILVIAAALYFHLLAVEPAKHRLLKWAALGCALTGMGLTLWFNLQRTDQLGDELYMNHLFPPAFRLAAPISADGFVDGLAKLRPTLDRLAKEPARGDEVGRVEEE